jgi:hypothetical protein
MKTMILLLAMLVAIPVDRAQADVSFGIFYSSLSAHGEWIALDAGVYAWRPLGVATGWRPYYYGRWLWTDDGWYWESEEPWAWAVYHYGRWYYDDYYGWLWTPGYDWAPAWVEWRVGGPYVGWAPLAPYAVFSFSFGIYYAHRWATPYNYWCFAPVHAVCNPGVHNYVYRASENARIIGRTRSAGSVRPEGRTIRTRGPDRTYIEQRGKTRISTTELVEVTDLRRSGISRDGSIERVQVYRPALRPDDRTDGSSLRPKDVRQAERPVNLDTRRIDQRARVQAREEGRDLEQALTRKQLRGMVPRSFREVVPRPRPESERRYETRIERGTRQPQFESPVPRRIERAPERPSGSRSGSVAPRGSSRAPASVDRSPSRSPSVRSPSGSPSRSRPASPPSSSRSGRRE